MTIDDVFRIYLWHLKIQKEANNPVGKEALFLLWEEISTYMHLEEALKLKQKQVPYEEAEPHSS